MERPSQAPNTMLVDVRPPTMSLLDVDPELGAGLPDAEFERARRVLATRAEVLTRGDWRPPTPSSPLAIGILVVSGLFVRELKLGESTAYAEILGPGDLLRPWQESNGAGLLPWTSSWRVLEEATVVALGPSIARAALRWPEVTAALMHKAVERTRRHAEAATIPSLVRIQDRMIVLFAHLAERWGHVTPAGISMHLSLTHELIARATGSRRPSVTTSLTALAERDLITRPRPNEWVLSHDIRDALAVVSGLAPLADAA